MDCLFCRIARKEIGAKIVYEDAGTLAFLDVHPIAPGHTVVIPKEHAETLLELDDAKIGPFFSSVKEVARILSRALAPDGFTIGANHGRSAGQLVSHLHVHVIPRFHDDGGKSLHSVVSNPPKEGLDEIHRKIVP